MPRISGTGALARRILLGSAVLALVCGPGLASLLRVEEYQVKAAFLHNFTKFVEWPDDGTLATADEFVIGILGEDPFDDAIDRIVTGKDVNGKRIRVQRFRSLEDLKPCHILFVSGRRAPSLPDIADRTAGEATLTVGETAGFAARGGIINFVVVNSRVRFEINPAAAEEANLRISSRLLSLAEVVE